MLRRKQTSVTDINLTFGEIFSKARHILRPELSFYVIAIIYGAAASVLSLAIPVSVQSLVNSVTFSGLLQPLFVLSFVLLILLIAYGALSGLQVYIIEMFQRRFYARMGSEITLTLLNANSKGLERRNGVELVNRYFDVMTVQKNMTILLTGASAIILQTLAGMFLLAFYHPYFLVFDALLVFLLFMVWILFGRKALEAAVGESKAKYKMARWFEEVAGANLFFKTRSRYGKTAEEADARIKGWLGNRSAHFRALFWQIAGLLAVYAVMSAAVLGLGGFLVIKGQLALGQLVAAELVATIILGGLARSGKYLEAFYDLCAAAEKISEFYKVPVDLERQTLREPSAPYDLVFSCAFARQGSGSFYFNQTFKQGKNYLINCKRHSAKAAFLELVRGVSRAKKGLVEFGGEDVNNISQLDLLEHIYCVERPVVVESSVYENLVYGNEGASASEIAEVLELVGLERLEDDLPDGLKTKLLASGYPLWSVELVKLEIARALLARPRVYIFTEVFDQLSGSVRESIIRRLRASDAAFILFSDKLDASDGFDELLTMDERGLNA